jgi:hypothetical protein
MTKLDPEYAVESYVEAEAKDLRNAVAILYEALDCDAYVLEVEAAEDAARRVSDCARSLTEVLTILRTRGASGARR